MNIDEINDWLNEQPYWLKYMVSLLLQKEVLADEDIKEVAKFCKKSESGEQIADAIKIDVSNLLSTATSNELKLESISNIENVNALSSTKPLEFSKDKITVVYGVNGSGKSSYVRLLKNVCNKRTKEDLIGNVYSENETTPQADIEYLINGSKGKFSWQNGKTCKDLQAVDIFDTSAQNLFVNLASTVTYEPAVLNLFSNIISTCDRVTAYFRNEINNISNTKLPVFPQDLQSTKVYDWLKNLSSKENDIENYCLKDEENLQIDGYSKRLSEANPAQQAKIVRDRQTAINEIIKNLQILEKQFSKDEIQKIISLKNDVDTKENDAKKVAESLKSNSELDGIGTDTWKTLWNAAKDYSLKYTYKQSAFPNIQSGARCVLCHQVLDKNAIKRFKAFDEYINGVAENKLKESKQILQGKLISLVQPSSNEIITAKLQAALITDENIVANIKNVFLQFENVLDAVQKLDNLENIPRIKTDDVLANLKETYASYEADAKKYEDDAKKDNRPEIQSKLNELKAKKWVKENKQAIFDEIERLKQIEFLESCKKLLNTRPISTKKGELSQTLITEDFIKRFNDEIKKLGASDIKVELIKDKVNKGEVLHKVMLKGAKQKADLQKVLSEGEYRIISIAAFLADVTARKINIPFIFDDPISSLDQDYEEAVVKRLIELSKQRQVIVFTHRLSLVGNIKLYAKEFGMKQDLIYIKKRDFLIGEPSDLPISQTDIKDSLKKLFERIPKIQNLQKENKDEDADIQIKATCSDFRTIIERSIEIDLFCETVQRFCRVIHPDNLKKIKKIKPQDCILLDELMTKYSCYEHSQPDETPIKLPSCEDLKQDIQELKDWREEYKNRCPPAS